MPVEITFLIGERNLEEQQISSLSKFTNIPLALIVQFRLDINALEVCRTISRSQNLSFIYQLTLLIDNVTFTETLGAVDEALLTRELANGRRGVFNRQSIRNRNTEESLDYDVLYLLQTEGVIQDFQILLS